MILSFEDTLYNTCRSIRGFLFLEHCNKKSHIYSSYFLADAMMVDDLPATQPQNKSPTKMFVGFIGLRSIDRFYSRPYRRPSVRVGPSIVDYVCDSILMIFCWFGHGRLGAWNIPIKSRFYRPRVRCGSFFFRSNSKEIVLFVHLLSSFFPEEMLCIDSARRKARTSRNFNWFSITAFSLLSGLGLVGAWRIQSEKTAKTTHFD